MTDNYFYPSLEDTEGGVITKDTDILAKLIGFIFMNPGDVTDLNDITRGSLGTVYAKHAHTPSVLASEVCSILQSHIDNVFDSGKYFIDGEIENTDNGDNTGVLILYVTDSNNNHVLTHNQILSEIIGD